MYLDILVVAFVILMGGFIVAQGDLSTYIATPMAIANPAIFTQDFSIQAFLQPNAQSISDLFCALQMRLGMSWQMVSIVGYIITAAVFGAGIIAISRHFCKENAWVMAGSLMFLSLYAVSGLRIGRNPIWYHSFYYAQLGFCLSVWAFYFGLKRKWMKAFIFITAATLFHFTVGSYSAAYMVIFLLLDTWREKKWKQMLVITPWVAAGIGVYLLMYLGGSTNTGVLSGEEFVKIHAFLRHPHHHVPSSWETLEWINYIAYIIGVGALTYAIAHRDEQYKTLRYIFLVSTGLMGLILLANYLFVEVVPLAFVAKLQPARCVFIYRFFLAGILAYVIQLSWREKAYLNAALILAFACIPQFGIQTFSGFFILGLGLALAVKAFAANKKWLIIEHLTTFGVILLIGLFFIITNGNIAIIMLYFKIFAILIIGYLLTMLIRLDLKKSGRIAMRVLVGLAAVVLFLIPWVDIQGQFERIRLKPVRIMYGPLDQDENIIALAERFKENTSPDILFFGDPHDIKTAYFRLYSERSSVVAYKNMPFTDEGMREWVDRQLAMGALKQDADGYYHKYEPAFSEMTPQAVMDYCLTYQATHLLIRGNVDQIQQFIAVGFTEFDSQNGWYILAVG